MTVFACLAVVHSHMMGLVTMAILCSTMLDLLEYSRLIKLTAKSTAKIQFPYMVYKYVHMFYRFATGLGTTLQ